MLRQILLVWALVGLAVGVCGCAPAIVGSDAGVYHVGKLYATASQDMTTVYGATVKALEDLEIAIAEKAKDAFYAKVVAKGADGKTIVARIKPGEGNLTKLSIKVGAFGDKDRSQVIYQQIQRNLGKAGK